MKLIDIRKAAAILNITEGQIIELLSRNMIQDAEIINEEIYIPLTEVESLKKHEELLLNLREMYGISSLSQVLKITPDTVRNWIKLGNISPDGFFQNSPLFSRETILSIKNRLEGDGSEKLKSRRNKHYKNSFEILNSYLPDSSPNLQALRDVTAILRSRPELYGSAVINLILAECSLQLINQRLGIWMKSSGELIRSFLNGYISLKDHQSLLRELIPNIPQAQSILDSCPELFRVTFYYEQHEDLLGCLYLSLLNLSERKDKGIYYTPSNVVGQLIATLSENDMLDDHCRYYDPCCGTGNFILNLPKIIHWTQIHASDIDRLAVTLCRINLFIRNPEIPINELEQRIVCSDYLKADGFINSEEEDGPLIIFGNPPWGARYDDQTRILLSQVYETASPMNCESFDLFLEKSISLTRTGDLISFVLPESILQVFAHKPARRLIQRYSSVKACIQLGEKFSGVNCPAIILTLRREPHLAEEDFLRCRRARITLKNHEHFEIENNRYYDGSMELFINNEEYRILNKILTVSNSTSLKNGAEWAIGIVTGDNARKLKKEKTPENEPILKGTNVGRYRLLLEDLSYIKFEPQDFQQVAREELYRSPEKLFYRFINLDLYFAYDNHGLLSLNSANLVIPRIPDLSIKYILCILNSCVARFIYRKKFHSAKVLRNHIESIPIKELPWDEQQYFIKTADKLISGTLSPKEEQKLLRDVDYKVGRLYGLTSKEVETVLHALGDTGES